jgi:hypothetical protein
MLPTDDDEEFFFDEDELDSSDVREVYKQFSNNARAFMLLRFRHFATFTAITAIVGTAAFQVKELEVFRLGVLFVGACVTVLFWLLDYRTRSYLTYYATQSRAFEERFIARPQLRHELIASIPKGGSLSANKITNAIFSFVLAAWMFLVCNALAGLLNTALIHARLQSSWF